MFRVNRRTDYAVRVVLALSRRPAGARLSTQAIQSEMQVPRAFLQRIVADLSKAGLVRTYAGPNGGLELARSSETIHLRQVWEAIEGPLEVSECLHGPGECPLDAGCPVRPRWGRLQSVLIHELEQSNFAQMALEAGLLPAPLDGRFIAEDIPLKAA